jgi:hypothetical protein
MRSAHSIKSSLTPTSFRNTSVSILHFNGVSDGNGRIRFAGTNSADARRQYSDTMRVHDEPVHLDKLGRLLKPGK